jgi:hypothetical protein
VPRVDTKGAIAVSRGKVLGRPVRDERLLNRALAFLAGGWSPIAKNARVCKGARKQGAASGMTR